MLGYAVARFGMTPSEFWDSTPWETDAIATAYLGRRDEDMRRQAYFDGQKIAYLGQWKKAQSPQEWVERLSAPFSGKPQRKRTWVPIASQAAMDEWERERAEFLTSLEPGPEETKDG
jgi:hypothetical protein